MLSLTEPEFSQEVLFKDRNYGRLHAISFVFRSYFLRLKQFLQVQLEAATVNTHGHLHGRSLHRLIHQKRLSVNLQKLREHRDLCSQGKLELRLMGAAEPFDLLALGTCLPL